MIIPMLAICLQMLILIGLLISFMSADKRYIKNTSELCSMQIERIERLESRMFKLEHERIKNLEERIGEHA